MFFAKAEIFYSFFYYSALFYAVIFEKPDSVFVYLFPRDYKRHGGRASDGGRCENPAYSVVNGNFFA